MKVLLALAGMIAPMILFASQESVPARLPALGPDIVLVGYASDFGSDIHLSAFQVLLALVVTIAPMILSARLANVPTLELPKQNNNVGTILSTLWLRFDVLRCPHAGTRES